MLEEQTTPMMIVHTLTFPSNQDVLMVQMKNCEPLVFGPALAIESVPGPSCGS